MARTARIIATEMPHHVLQRGNRRQVVFFNDGDRETYLSLLKEQCDLYGVNVWAYCLMDNHVHLIVVPKEEGSLARAMGETHKRYTRMINFRESWRGYLWQDRFKSFVLDERYVYAAVRYVERNPVRAGIVRSAEEYRWSSAPAHVEGRKDPILSDFYLLDEIEDWSAYLKDDELEENLKLFRRHGESGRPLGDPARLMSLAVKYGWDLTPKKRGPKPKNLALN